MIEPRTDGLDAQRTGEPPLVVIVDDDASVRKSTQRLIRSFGYRAEAFASGEEFLASPVAGRTACLVLDVRMPVMDGVEVQRRLGARDVRIPVVFISGRASEDEERRARTAGAVDFLRKPVATATLQRVLRAALEKERSTMEATPDALAIDDERSREGDDAASVAARHGIVGRSVALQRVVGLVETVATTDAAVLIRGETGTGKELIAGLIHALGARRSAPLVKFNCTAIPAGLLESELFGHERGAFTGAIARRIGRFELANRGTLLLDEIGDLPLELQPKLLRVLEEREFERIGGTQTIRSDVRVVAATNRPLEELVGEGAFRADLYYRLNVFPIDLPPLRERTEDIPPLVRHFVRHHARRVGRRIESIPPDVMEQLVRHPWPGNVRELQHVVQRAVILSSGERLELPPLDSPVKTASRPANGETFDGAVREHIVEVLRETNGVVAGPRGAAARLGLKRSTLQSKMERLGIGRADLVMPRRPVAPSSSWTAI